MLVQTFRLMALVGIAFGVAHHYNIGRSEAAYPDARPQQASAMPAGQADQYYSITQQDMDYINSYLNNTDQGRSFAFGTTNQMISLPSGGAVEFQIQKTNTGWCPIRHEPTFSISFQSKKPFVLKK